MAPFVSIYMRKFVNQFSSFLRQPLWGIPWHQAKFRDFWNWFAFFRIKKPITTMLVAKSCALVFNTPLISLYKPKHRLKKTKRIFEPISSNHFTHLPFKYNNQTMKCHSLTCHMYLCMLSTEKVSRPNPSRNLVSSKEIVRFVCSLCENYYETFSIFTTISRGHIMR